MQLFRRDAADGVELARRSDVLRLVKAAENTDLGKIRYACEQHEAQMFVSQFKHRVELLQQFAVIRLPDSRLFVSRHRLFRFEHIEQRFVVLVHQHHHRLSRGEVCRLDDIGEPQRRRTRVRLAAIELFPSAEQAVEQFLQEARPGEITNAEIYVEHGVWGPVLFQTFHGQSLKEFLVPLEIIFQR